MLAPRSWEELAYRIRVLKTRNRMAKGRIRCSNWNNVLTLTGQMKYLDRISTLVIINPKNIVMIHPPTKPSTVFLGESLIN